MKKKKVDLLIRGVSPSTRNFIKKQKSKLGLKNLGQYLEKLIKEEKLRIKDVKKSS
jgi:hypothetical protein